MGSIVVIGHGFGSLVLIAAETAFVNPKDVEHTDWVGCEDISEKYLTDPDLLER